METIVLVVYGGTKVGKWSLTDKQSGHKTMRIVAQMYSEGSKQAEFPKIGFQNVHVNLVLYTCTSVEREWETGIENNHCIYDNIHSCSQPV